MDSDSPIARVLRQREITRHTLQHLPLLIPLGVVLEITGLSYKDVAQEVRSGRLRAWQGRPGGNKRYFRADVLAIAGLGPSGDDERATNQAKSGANGVNPCPAPSTNGSRGLTPPPA